MVEMSLMTRASHSATLFEQGNLSLNDKEMLVALGSHSTTPSPPLYPPP